LPKLFDFCIFPIISTDYFLRMLKKIIPALSPAKSPCPTFVSKHPRAESRREDELQEQRSQSRWCRTMALRSASRHSSGLSPWGRRRGGPGHGLRSRCAEQPTASMTVPPPRACRPRVASPRPVIDSSVGTRQAVQSRCRRHSLALSHVYDCCCCSRLLCYPTLLSAFRE
jgi:hypothetical protein